VSGRPKTPFVPLSIDYFADERVLDVSPAARLAYLAGLTVSKRFVSDGVVSLGQIKRELVDVRRVDVLVRELVRVGLWRELDSNRFVVCGYLRWNESAVEREERRNELARRGAKGGRAGRARPEIRADGLADGLAGAEADPLAHDTDTDTDAENDTDTTGTGANGAAANEEDPRLTEVVGIYARRAAEHNGGVKSPARYVEAVKRRLLDERGVEVRRLLAERPSARAEQLVDILEKSSRATS